LNVYPSRYRFIGVPVTWNAKSPQPQVSTDRHEDTTTQKGYVGMTESIAQQDPFGLTGVRDLQDYARALAGLVKQGRRVSLLLSRMPSSADERTRSRRDSFCVDSAVTTLRLGAGRSVQRCAVVAAWVVTGGFVGSALQVLDGE
jgi:hypothetical protein